MSQDASGAVVVPSTLDRLAERFDTAAHKKVKKGGREQTYVPWTDKVERLNEVLGPDWSFRIIREGLTDTEAWVLGELTATIDGVVTVRQQYGCEAITRGQSASPVTDLFKIAGTDALSKAATLLGVGMYLSIAEERAEVEAAMQEAVRAAMEERRNPTQRQATPAPTPAAAPTPQASRSASTPSAASAAPSSSSTTATAATPTSDELLQAALEYAPARDGPSSRPHADQRRLRLRGPEGPAARARQAPVDAERPLGRDDGRAHDPSLVEGAPDRQHRPDRARGVRRRGRGRRARAGGSPMRAASVGRRPCRRPGAAPTTSTGPASGSTRAT
jgi:hypothetical protein